MWSEGFRFEEQMARRAKPLDLYLAWGAGLAAAAALATEVVMSIVVTSEQLTSQTGSAGMGLLAIGLGFVGPYSSLLAWRAATSAGHPQLTRIRTTALVGFGVAAMAVAWLLLLHSFHPPVRLIPAP